MIMLSAIFSTVFLSPLLFALPVVIGIALLLMRRRKAAAWLISVPTFLLLALSTGVARDLVLRPLEYRNPPFPAHAPSVDAIVVLGGGVVRGTPEEEYAGLAQASLKRLATAYTLYRRLGVPVIVSGGTTWREAGERSEADIAAATLEGFGMPGDRVIREGKSRTTWENAREVARILAGRGASRVALVTSAAHMPRALLAFSRAGVACVPAPADYLSRMRRGTLIDLLPSFSALSECFVGFQEYFGIVLYTIRR